MTFADYSAKWKTTFLPAMKPASVTAMTSHCQKLVVFFGQTELSNLTDSVVQTAVNDLNQTLCPKTVVCIMGTLHNILRRAAREGLILTVPEPSLPQVRAQAQPWYTVEEARRYAKDAPGALANLCYLLTETGLRIGEALALADFNVNLEAGTLLVNRGIFNGVTQTTKCSSSDRVLSISEHLKVLLSDTIRVQGPGFLFKTSKRTPPRPAHLAEALVATGLPWKGFHAFRRTNATIMAQLGVPEQVADARQGHANATGLTYRLYAQRAGLQDKEWVEKIAKILQG